MKATRLVALAAALVAGVGTVFAAEEANKAPSDPQQQTRRAVDLAICLDTSNSMDGLIGSAKQKLWAIVNELATARPRPALRVALYQYGNNGLNAETGWVQQVCELTGDLDAVYGKLFALRTNGGTEFVARVIRVATDNLKWSPDRNALKIIVVAGNEPATQDAKFKLEDSCKAAAGSGIIVNTIFCGNEVEGRSTGWADAARWADGRFAAIDQDSGTVVINTPYDKRLADLGAGLNKTYVAYGKAGREGAANQAAQDANASSLGAPAAALRAQAKAGSLYGNARWDLVDASKEKDFDLSKMKEEDLSDEMRKMNAEQRKAYIAEQAKKREAIQKEIKELSARRDEAIKQEMGKKGLNEKSAFDAALRQAVREQAEKKDFKFEK